MDDDERLKKANSNTNKAHSYNLYLTPSPDYGVFVGVHIGYQTYIFFFARFRADLKITSQRPVGLDEPDTTQPI